ncbi:hypothetical protein B0A65_15340 [Flavobacterium frigidimaris]|uniref:Uncharacterized protein n=1 Tax=Flavobacterium frigidimaris TaxID=262320 RepID=A0ABX4BNJ6_FLAFR|nr:hypothetical protein B0A65_15340 [Flavobacterium frigidimaris]
MQIYNIEHAFYNQIFTFLNKFIFLGLNSIKTKNLTLNFTNQNQKKEIREFVAEKRSVHIHL